MDYRFTEDCEDQSDNDVLDLSSKLESSKTGYIKKTNFSRIMGSSFIQTLSVDSKEILEILKS